MDQPTSKNTKYKLLNTNLPFFTLIKLIRHIRAWYLLNVFIKIYIKRALGLTVEPAYYVVSVLLGNSNYKSYNIPNKMYVQQFQFCVLI